MANIKPMPVPQTRDSLALSPEVPLVAFSPELLLFVPGGSVLLNVHPYVKILVGHPPSFHCLLLCAEGEVLGFGFLDDGSGGGFGFWFDYSFPSSRFIPTT